MIRKIVALLVLIPSLAFATAPDAPTDVTADMTPNWVYDETLPFQVYAENYSDWKMEMFIGNINTSTAIWYDGLGTEAGYGSPQACADGPAGSYKSYCAIAASERWPHLVEYDFQTGNARLMLAAFGKDTGDSTEAAGGYPFYNSYDDSVYLMGKGFCIRKLVDDGDGTHSVSLVAGDCDVSGQTDGNGANATFGSIVGATADGAGNIWVWDKHSSNKLRKVDVNGVVSTITDAVRDDGNPSILCLLNKYRPVLLSGGKDSSSIHIADSYSCGGYGWSIQRMDTSTHAMTRVVGVLPSNPRYTGENKDGPGLTHAYQQFSGIGGFYSRFYDMIMVHGNDNTTLQLYDYRTDWVYTKGHKMRPWLTRPTHTDAALYNSAIPLEAQAIRPGSNISPYVKGVDRYGGVYYSFAQGIRPTVRIYNPTLGGLALGDIQ